jgi:ABC-type lipoprotein export system ATPase subunit
MVELFKREQKENKATTIVVSHNKAFLEAADTLFAACAPMCLPSNSTC